MDNKEEVKTVVSQMFDDMREHGKSPNTGPKPVVSGEANDLTKTIDLMEDQTLDNINSLGTSNGAKNQ
jgi:hypothetical protein